MLCTGELERLLPTQWDSIINVAGNSPPRIRSFMSEIIFAGTVVAGNIKEEKVIADLSKARKRDAQIVKGRFENKENENATMRFIYKKYKEEPVVKYELKDGEEYYLPVGVADHINNDIGMWEHEALCDSKGKQTSESKPKRIRRCQFVPLGFGPIEEIQELEPVKEEKTVLPPLIKTKK